MDRITGFKPKLRYNRTVVCWQQTMTRPVLATVRRPPAENPTRPRSDRSQEKFRSELHRAAIHRARAYAALAIRARSLSELSLDLWRPAEIVGTWLSPSGAERSSLEFLCRIQFRLLVTGNSSMVTGISNPPPETAIPSES